MVIAKRADPGYRRRLTSKQMEEADAMLHSILQRMDRLLFSMCRKAYSRFQHHTDRAMGLDDLVSIVRAGLVLGVYRYKRNGKYEPYNYLMGVINVVLRNVHNWRNRKKRIPPTLLLSMDAPTRANEELLANSLSDEQRPPMIQIDRQTLFGGTPKSPARISQDVVSDRRQDPCWESITSDADIESRMAPFIVRAEIGTLTSSDVLDLIISGQGVQSVAEAAGVKLPRMRRFIKKYITSRLNSVI